MSGIMTMGVCEMLDALVWDGALSKCENVREASGKAQVRPKSIHIHTILYSFGYGSRGRASPVSPVGKCWL